MTDSRPKVGNLVRFAASPAPHWDKYLGQVGLVVRVSPNGLNLTVNMLKGGRIGLMAWSWFEVVSA